MSNQPSKNHFHLLWVVAVVGVVFGAALIITSCKPKEIDLPFETIEQKEWTPAYEAREAGLTVISRLEEVSNLAGFVTSDAETILQQLDYDNYFALIVFQGWKPTTRYSVQIQRIVRQGNTVNIYTQFQEPKPDEPVGGIVTSPYHLVQVQKVGEWGQEISFQVIVDKTSVVSLTQFIP